MQNLSLLWVTRHWPNAEAWLSITAETPRGQRQEAHRGYHDHWMM